MKADRAMSELGNTAGRFGRNPQIVAILAVAVKGEGEGGEGAE